MSCQTVRNALGAAVDRRLSRAERRRIGEHLAGCPECAEWSERVTEIRSLLRRLPSPTPPAWLATQLKVLASHERLRQQSRSTWHSFFREWLAQAHLMIDNMMRPLALPFAGGLVSAMVLFSMLVPSLQLLPGPLSNTPTALYTEPTIATTSPFGFSDEVLVELVINEEGRVVDYEVRDRQMSRELIAEIGNMILFTSFRPATSFGQPTAGRVLVSFRRSNIIVKG